MNPLRPSVYLFRNLRKTAPLAAAIMLAVLLIMGIVSMMNSIPLSIRTIYSYSKASLGVTPRGDPSQTAVLKKEIEEKSPVPIERILVVRGSSANVRSIVGKWPFIVLAMSQPDMRYYLEKLDSTTITGRLPAQGEPEALISRPVARNLNLTIGSELIGPEQSEAYSPKSVKVVGIAETNEWIMLAPIEYHRANHFPPVDALMVFASNPADQELLDRWAVEHFKGERAQLFAYHELEEDTVQMFKTLYVILDIVIANLVIVITLMVAMLINIYQSQRVQEFGLLQALGYSRKSLLRRTLAEIIVVLVLGWSLGLLVASGLLQLAKALLMEPRAFAMSALDPVALLYTVPVPVTILLATIYTVWRNFNELDPVAVLERRLV